MKPLHDKNSESLEKTRYLSTGQTKGKVTTIFGKQYHQEEHNKCEWARQMVMLIDLMTLRPPAHLSPFSQLCARKRTFNQQKTTLITDLVPCKCIKFSNTVTKGTISINDPDFCIWVAKFGTQCKSTSNSKSSKCSWVQPCQRTTWPKQK